jgi:hypothetical protein
MISALLILSVEFKKMLSQNPNMPVISSGMVKDWVEKGAH